MTVERMSTHAICETMKKSLSTNRLGSANKDAQVCRPPNRILVTILESRKTSRLFRQFMLSEASTKDLLGTRILHERRIRGPVLDALKRSCICSLLSWPPSPVQVLSLFLS
jgi:hypothetical protein